MDTKIVKIDVRNENNKEKIFSYFVFFKKRSPNLIRNVFENKHN